MFAYSHELISNYTHLLLAWLSLQADQFRPAGLCSANLEQVRKVDPKLAVVYLKVMSCVACGYSRLKNKANFYNN